MGVLSSEMSPETIEVVFGVGGNRSSRDNSLPVVSVRRGASVLRNVNGSGRQTSPSSELNVKAHSPNCWLRGTKPAR